MENQKQTNSGSVNPNDDKNEKKNNELKDEEKCKICLNKINNSAMTDTCRHSFCLDCIREWSQRRNDCPLCRRMYNNILCNVGTTAEVNSIPVRAQPNAQNQGLNENQILMEDQLNQMIHYSEFQEQLIIQLTEGLNHLDPNTIEYIEHLQRIANAEVRYEQSLEMVQQLRHNLQQYRLQRRQLRQQRNDIRHQNNANQQNNSQVEPPPPPPQAQNQIVFNPNQNTGNGHKQNPPVIAIRAALPLTPNISQNGQRNVIISGNSGQNQNQQKENGLNPNNQNQEVNNNPQNIVLNNANHQKENNIQNSNNSGTQNQNPGNTGNSGSSDQKQQNNNNSQNGNSK